MNLKDQITGMFLGVGIGDALGMPVETLSKEEIASRFGRITTYLSPNGHKWFKGLKAGKWTDDTQLTLAIAESLIKKGGIDLDDIAARHISAMGECDIGWGRSTKESIQRIKNGVHWSKSGNPQGAGNGVAMKVSPIGAYLTAKFFSRGLKSWSLDEDKKRIISDLILMTHKTNLAITSAFAQIFAITSCLENDPFSIEDFFHRVFAGVIIGEREDDPDKLSERIRMLQKKMRKGVLTDKQIVNTFDRGTCYVYNSLPFSYAFFLRKPHSIEVLYDVVSSGGDTDTNGSIVGSLLGALNGTSIFPQHLIDGLWRKDKIFEIADQFCNRFKILK